MKTEEAILMQEEITFAKDEHVRDELSNRFLIEKDLRQKNQDIITSSANKLKDLKKEEENTIQN